MPIYACCTTKPAEYKRKSQYYNVRTNNVKKLTAFTGKLADLNEQHGNPKDEDLFAGEELAESSLMNDILIANGYAEELTRAQYSRDAENRLDNHGEKAENEI